MTHGYNPLFTTISAIQYRANCDRDFFLALSGLKDRWSLGEKEMKGYHLIDVTAEEILQFIRSECGV